MTETRQGAYGADDDIVDYILGITFEIWEQRGVELIREYYADDCTIYGLDGIVNGATEVVDGTYKTLEAFPDRLLLAENVIWSGCQEDGYYSSHRLLSLMTNKGATIYGPPTNERVRIMNIADCVVEDGVITREWLVRDNMTLAQQLGAEPVQAARDMAARRTGQHRDWMNAEIERLRRVDAPDDSTEIVSPRVDPESFAWRVLTASWAGDADRFLATHSPYSVLHRSPLRHYSGNRSVFDYYQTLATAMGDIKISVDHVASQPFAGNGIDIAVRWSATGYHKAPIVGVEATDKPLFIMAVTHWRCIADRISAEWTIFDDLAVLSQILDE